MEKTTKNTQKREFILPNLVHLQKIHAENIKKEKLFEDVS